MLTLTTALISCSPKVPDSVVYSAKPIDRPRLVIPTVDQFTRRDIQWIVVTPANAETIFRDKGEVALFALTSEGYKNLSLNTADQLKLILQQQAVIAAYSTYYQKADTEINNFNKEQAALTRRINLENNPPPTKSWYETW